jgi:hypothetical protein
MYTSNILRFDGENKIIYTSVSDLSMLEIYKQWKRWVINSDNSKFQQAFACDDSNIILVNGWIINIIKK